MTRTLAVAVALVIAAAGPAAADPFSPELSPPQLTPLQPAPPPPPQPKSRGLAAALSALGSVAPYALFGPMMQSEHPSRGAQDLALTGAAMLVVLPSAGHWYAGEGFTLGFATRIAGAGAIAWAIESSRSSSCSDCGGLASPGVVLGSLAGGALILAGQIYDIATAPGAADRWNREHGAMIVPAPMPIGTGYGVGVVGAF